MKHRLDEDYALKMDAEDPLASFKERFYPLGDSVYMDGNSLGLMSKDAEKSLLRLIEEWKTLGIKGWEGGKIPWIKYAEELGNLQAPLVGADVDECVVTGGTTINLHTLISTFYQPKGKRRKILADEMNFPSDLYALRAQIKLKGGEPDKDLILVRSRDGIIIEEEDVISTMSDEMALVVLPSVYYKSGQLLDIDRITKEAHRYQIIVGFDCSHSVGVVPHYFSKWDIDFAFWCNYKYMNGGPGSSGSIYVNKKHWGKLPGMTGWFGNARSTMFEMKTEFDPARTTAAWQVGTPTILSTAPIEGSLRMMREAGIEKIREKSLKITGYLMYLIDEILSEAPYNYGIATPRAPERRGGHVGVYHMNAWKINQALIAFGVIPDFRPPNIIRLAPIPLYVSYHEVWKVVQILKSVIDEGNIEKFSDDKSTVT
jgi:kynureninase